MSYSRNSRGAALIRRLDSVVPALLREEGVPGLSLALIDNGLKVCERILTDVVGGYYPVFSVLHVTTLGLEDQPDE